MKKILLTVLLSASALSLSAQYRDSESMRERLRWDDEMLHIMLDTRFDLRFVNLNGSSELGFKGQSLRFWLEGEIIPGIRYRLRHRFNKPQDPLLDGLADATDHAWIAFDLGKSKQWTITVGKQSVQLGTYEYDYNSADNYISTMVNGDFDGHQIGVNAAYRFLGQTVNLQLFNAGSVQFATEEYRKKAFGASFMWQGSFIDGLLKTRTGYTLLQHSSDKFYSWITTGWQVSSGQFTTELDYYIGDRDMDYSGMAGDPGQRPVRDQSAAINLKYGHGKWRPFIKGTWDKRRDRDLSSDVYETYGIQAVVEYYPFTGHKYVKDLRFHLAYGYTTTRLMGQWENTPETNQHLAIAGIRWFFNAK